MGLGSRQGHRKRGDNALTILSVTLFNHLGVSRSFRWHVFPEHCPNLPSPFLLTPHGTGEGIGGSGSGSSLDLPLPGCVIFRGSLSHPELYFLQQTTENGAAGPSHSQQYLVCELYGGLVLQKMLDPRPRHGSGRCGPELDLFTFLFISPQGSCTLGFPPPLGRLQVSA